jgi:hypothetical protein
MSGTRHEKSKLGNPKSYNITVYHAKQKKKSNKINFIFADIGNHFQT